MSEAALGTLGKCCKMTCLYRQLGPAGKPRGPTVQQQALKNVKAMGTPTIAAQKVTVMNATANRSACRVSKNRVPNKGGGTCRANRQTATKHLFANVRPISGQCIMR